MGKLNAKNPRRSSHPAHMPRYRMFQRSKIESLLKILHHILGPVIFRGTDLPLGKPKGWFQERKAAEKAIANSKITRNQFILVDNGFRGVSKRHWVYHRKCGNHIFVSTELLLRVGHRACIYCGGAEDMKACGTISLLQKFVWVRSNQNVNLVEPESLGSSLDEHAFYCMIHQEIYMTTYSDFLKEAGITNSCPHCMTEAASRI